MYEAELAVYNVYVEYLSSSSGTNMGLTYYLSHYVFSETYIQLQTKFRDRASYI
jgi:hypothetical protein